MGWKYLLTLIRWAPLCGATKKYKPISLTACNIPRAKVFKRDRYERRTAGTFHERRVFSRRADDSSSWTSPYPWIRSWTYPESLVLAMSMEEFLAVRGRKSRLTLPESFSASQKFLHFTFCNHLNYSHFYTRRPGKFPEDLESFCK